MYAYSAHLAARQGKVLRRPPHRAWYLPLVVPVDARPSSVQVGPGKLGSCKPPTAATQATVRPTYARTVPCTVDGGRCTACCGPSGPTCADHCVRGLRSAVGAAAAAGGGGAAVGADRQAPMLLLAQCCLVGSLWPMHLHGPAASVLVKAWQRCLCTQVADKVDRPGHAQEVRDVVAALTSAGSGPAFRHHHPTRLCTIAADSKAKSASGWRHARPPTSLSLYGRSAPGTEQALMKVGLSLAHPAGNQK